MSKDHKDFLKAVIVFSILFWGVYFFGTWGVYRVASHISSINPEFGYMLESQLFKFDEGNF